MDRYALLRLAMSWSEALVTLGFPPNSSPSQADIKEAYKQKAFDTHPDRNGGDDEPFKLVGIAYDILDGKPRPTYDRRPDDDVPDAPARPAYKPPESKTVKFEEAVSKAGLPAGVEWLFVTPSQRDKSGWRGDSSGKSYRAVVAYGRTDSQHVFLAALNYEEYSNFVLGGFHHDIWEAKSYEYPIKGDEGLNPAWLYGHVVKALKDIGYHGKFNSKVIDAKGWKLSDRFPHGSDVSIKHWLVNTKQVAGDAPSVAGRKQTVEFVLGQSSYSPKPGYYPEPKRPSNFWDGEYRGSYYKITLNINGHPYELNEADTTKFLGLNRPLDAVFGGSNYYDGSKKTLTRMPKAKKLLAWMGENFTGLPDAAQQALKAAAEQMKG